MRLEPVPVDVFEFTSASVTVGSRTMVASAFAGVPPTPSRGLTGEVVYVGAGSAADYEAAPSVAGKLVLVDFTLDYYWWLFCYGAQADLRGAAGIIMTHAPISGDWYSAAPDALGTMDAMYDFDLPPMVYVSEPDGDWIKAQLQTAAAAGTPLTARLSLKQKVTLADAGGVGYNVVAELPGRVDDGTFVLYCSHHDAHFTGGLDDTSGVAAELAIARAMAQSRYRPQHKVIFLFTTGEEFGYTNARWDWAIGAWWANRRAHPGWAGRARAMVNLEMVGSAGTPLVAQANVELASWLDARSKALSTLLPVRRRLPAWTHPERRRCVDVLGRRRPSGQSDGSAGQRGHVAHELRRSRLLPDRLGLRGADREVHLPAAGGPRHAASALRPQGSR